MSSRPMGARCAPRKVHRLPSQCCIPMTRPMRRLRRPSRMSGRRSVSRWICRLCPTISSSADFLASRTYQAALVDLNLSRTPDPDPYPFWHQAEATGGQNYSQWDNRAASEYLEQARVTADPTLRTAALSQLPGGLCQGTCPRCRCLSRSIPTAWTRRCRACRSVRCMIQLIAWRHFRTGIC